MRRFCLLSLLVPVLSWAGAYDYYECATPDGGVTYSVERCAKGQRQRRIEDNTEPVGRGLGNAVGGTVRLESRRGGHFVTTVNINGVPMRALIDTGATLVALSAEAASRARIDLRRGRQGNVSTANGKASVTVVTLDSVELGGNTVRQVRGTVHGTGLGNVDVLLGMAFLNHFEVNSDGIVMTLRPK